jgi:mono/diheme cytochrome c family protein
MAVARNIRRTLAVCAWLVIAAACAAEPSGTPQVPELNPQEAEGQAVFSIHCAACHATAPETVLAGPSLAGIGTLAGVRIPGMSAEEYIRRSILSPYDYLVEGFIEAMPPDFGKQLTGEEFDAVVAFLMTLE